MSSLPLQPAPILPTYSPCRDCDEAFRDEPLPTELFEIEQEESERHSFVRLPGEEEELERWDGMA